MYIIFKYIYIYTRTLCFAVAKKRKYVIFETCISCGWSALFPFSFLLTCGQQRSWARAFCVAGAVFCDGVKNMFNKKKCSFLLAGARDSRIFWCVEVCFFHVVSVFYRGSWLCVFFLHWTARLFCVAGAVLCDGWKSDSFIFAGRRTGFLRLLMYRKCEFSFCFFVWWFMSFLIFLSIKG